MKVIRNMVESAKKAKKEKKEKKDKEQKNTDIKTTNMTTYHSVPSKGNHK